MDICNNRQRAKSKSFSYMNLMKFIIVLPNNKSLLRILWFNWRDLRNPDAGGAEVFTHEIMRRLVKRGYDMTLFSSEFPNSLPYENWEGVNIVRDGGKYTVYSKAKRHYREYSQKYDVIIDEINTRPFMTPKFVKGKPLFAVFHQLAREFWFYETRFPLNYIGYYYLERKWLSYYKDLPTITVSNSSKRDLQALGFKNILMVPEGLNVTPLFEVPNKERDPTVVFIGRLKKAKLPHHALQAFGLIKKQVPDARMWIIGDGYLRDELEKNSIQDVKFYGHVSSELKFELLSKAHLVLMPAVREGWGLVVTESNAMGTPVVSYNVPGLIDSVRNGETGLILDENSPASLARDAIRLLKDRDFLYKLSSNALAFSRDFSWDTTADVFEKIINTI